MGLVSEQMSGRTGPGYGPGGRGVYWLPGGARAEYFRLRHVHIMGNETLTRQDVHYLLALPTPVTLFQLDLTRMGSVSNGIPM